MHFPPETAPEDVAWKLLAVNASDLAAMGAEPLSAHVSGHAPPRESAWLHRFTAGLDAPARAFGLALDTVHTGTGPTEATATVVGRVPVGAALRRDGARAGDSVWVTGTLGDAGLALSAWQTGHPLPARHAGWLRARLDRPTPRLAAGRALRGLASAAIDVSDGLAQDLGHVLEASGVGAVVEVARLPRSPALAECVPLARADALVLGAGDDYELCFTAPPGATADIVRALGAAGCAAHRVGHVVEEPGLRVLDADGAPHALPAGYDHFRLGGTRP